MILEETICPDCKYSAFDSMRCESCVYGSNRIELTVNEYQKEALRTVTEKDKLINGVMGLCGEAGECIDIVKKATFQGHELDKNHLAEELGDVAWYLAVAADAIGYDLLTILQMNVAKLNERYPEGFDSERSVNR